MDARRLAMLFALALLFSALVGSASGPMAARAQGGNPLTTEQHYRLAFLAGQWEEEITYASSPPEQPREKGQWTARPALGLYLVIQYTGASSQPPYRAFAVLTYARDEQAYRMWWFDNAAGIGEYRGNFTDENTLALEHVGKVEGKAFRERIRFTRVSPTEVRTNIEQAWETGEFRPYLEAVAHRTGEAPAREPAQRPPQNDGPKK